MDIFQRYSEKNIFRFIVFISVFVLFAVILLNRKVLPRPEPMPGFVTWLPALNATINATCSLLLILSYRAIRRKDIQLHKKLNLTTFLLSCLFLISYISYHWMADETRFPADHPLRPVYLTILLSHIVLAAGVLPLVLQTFYLGLTNKVEKHRRWAKITFPIWLYVTITGVIVYLMIRPHYPW